MDKREQQFRKGTNEYMGSPSSLGDPKALGGRLLCFGCAIGKAWKQETSLVLVQDLGKGSPGRHSWYPPGLSIDSMWTGLWNLCWEVSSQRKEFFLRDWTWRFSYGLWTLWDVNKNDPIRSRKLLLSTYPFSSPILHSWSPHHGQGFLRVCLWHWYCQLCWMSGFCPQDKGWSSSSLLWPYLLSPHNERNTGEIQGILRVGRLYFILYTYTESSKNEKLEYKGNVAPWIRHPLRFCVLHFPSHLVNIWCLHLLHPFHLSLDYISLSSWLVLLRSMAHSAYFGFLQ